MKKYIFKRLVQLIPVILGITLFAFLIFYLAPGDPVQIMLEEGAPREMVEIMRVHLGLDQPFHIQYWRFITSLVRLDLGISFRSRIPVSVTLFPAVRATIILSIITMFFTIFVGFPAGIIAAVRRNSFIDRLLMSLCVMGFSAPVFWIGILLMYFFTYHVRLFAIVGGQHWTGVILPSLALGLHWAPAVARMTRSCMLDVLEQDYIRTAYAKGLAFRSVYWKHALKNAALPILTVLGLQLGQILGGAIIVEKIFAWPGVGRLLLQGILWRDAPIVRAGIVIIALLFCLINIVVDLLYAYLNPVIRYD